MQSFFVSNIPLYLVLCIINLDGENIHLRKIHLDLNHLLKNKDCFSLYRLLSFGVTFKGTVDEKLCDPLFLVAFPIGLQKAFSDRILSNINAYKFENRLFSIVVSLQN